MKDFEALDLQKMADEYDIEMDIHQFPPHGLGVSFQRQIWLADFCVALKVLEDIRVKNLIKEIEKKNEQFVKIKRF